MRRLLLAAALAVSALTVSACSPMASEPATVADKTKLDEQSMLSAETLYYSTNVLAQIAFDTGKLTTDQREKVKAADNKAYKALGALRAAYRAGNSTSYYKALAELMTASDQVTALTGGLK